MVAVGNRVLLRRGDDSFFNHPELNFFVASSFISGVVTGSSVHRPNDDVLLALALFADGIKEFFLCTRWYRLVAVGYLSAKEESPKGW